MLAGWISVRSAGYSMAGPFVQRVGSEWPFEIAGLVLPGYCSGISLPSWWRVWM